MKLFDKDYCLNCGARVRVMAFRKEGYCSGACAKVIANGRQVKEEADVIAFEKRQKKLTKKGKK